MVYERLPTDHAGVQEWRLASTRDAQAQIFVRARGSATVSPVPLVLVHGFFQPASAILDVPEHSLQAALAAAGWRVYLFDFRGYGLSSRPAFMNAPPHASQPGLGCMADAQADLHDVVDFVRAREGVAAVDLLGYSWGTARSANFALSNPEQVRRLALYAPVWRPTTGAAGEAVDPQQPQRLNPRWGGYAQFQPGDLQRNWDWEINGADAGLFRCAKALQAADRALMDSDPSLTQPAYRAPLGPMVDALAVAQGQALFAAEMLQHPTLLLRGAQDRLSSADDACSLYAALGTPQKRLVTLERGTHLLHLEHASGELVREVTAFLQRG